MKSAIIVLLVLLCLFQGETNAQNKTIDSLKTLLKTAREDTNKVNTFNALGWENSQMSNYDTALYYSQNAVQLAEKLNFKKGVIEAYDNMGNLYCDQGKYPEALKMHFASLKISQEMGDKHGMTFSYNKIGDVYLYQGNYPEALKTHLASLKISEEIGDKNGIASSYNSIGGVCMYQGNYPEALKNYFAALKINEEKGNKRKAANNYGNIGNVYLVLGNYPEALKNTLAALKIVKEMGDKNRMANAYNSIAIIYQHQGKYPEALKYLFSALKINEEAVNNMQITNNYNNIGSIYSDQGNYPEALKNYFAALKISEGIKDKRATASCFSHIGNVYLKLNRSGEAKEWLQKGLDLSRKIGLKSNIESSYKDLSFADSTLGNYRDAYYNYKMYTLYHDSLFNEENTKKLTQTAMQYEFDKKEAVVKATQEKKEAISKAAIQRQKLVRNGFIGGFAVMLLFAGVFFTQRNKISKEKKRSDELLYNILPEEISNDLKERGATTAKEFGAVTVLFTDFVGFTNAGERMTPQQLIEELHHCFKAFDEIIMKYNIEKIKTIGDAYLAVSGLPVANDQHALNIANAALEIRNFMAERRAQQGDKTFEIRIGIHSGSVIAGIVGIKKFAYDIWGDTVNTAARMEQNSEAGKVNISGTTYELVKDEFACSYRGKIQAKNKGFLDMYFVQGASSSTQAQ